MLGKLIKYDLKSTSRFLIIIHGFLLLFSVFGRLFLTSRLSFGEDSLSELGLGLIFVLYLMLFMGAGFATSIIIAVRFYKNLFSDEGYLTHTLPVKRSMHLFSKTVSGSIWLIIDILAIYLCAYILIAVDAVAKPLGEHWGEFGSELGFDGAAGLNLFLVYMLVISILGCISSVIMIQASVLFGQLFNGHKVLGAVVSYFVITTVLSLISTAVIGLHGIFSGADNYLNVSHNFAGYMYDTLNFSIILEIVTTVILYLASYLIMKKKVNLS